MRLEHAVDDFLAATALWTTQWFNKPKFHVVLHILFHIRRFGPAILCATETFESFNYVIRARSVHSNRQAPSIDIGNAFDHMHAVRHLVSGGWIVQDASNKRNPLVRQAGPGVLALVKDKVFLRLMGISDFFRLSDYGMMPVHLKAIQIS